MINQIFVCVLWSVAFAEDAVTPHVQCFVCDSTTNKYCADTFHVTGIPVKTCRGGCAKAKLEDNQVYRYCVGAEVMEECTTHKGPRSVECYCKRNLCNSASVNVVELNVLCIAVTLVLWGMFMVTYQTM